MKASIYSFASSKLGSWLIVIGILLIIMYIGGEYGGSHVKGH